MRSPPVELKFAFVDLSQGRFHYKNCDQRLQIECETAARVAVRGAAAERAPLAIVIVRRPVCR